MFTRMYGSEEYLCVNLLHDASVCALSDFNLCFCLFSGPAICVPAHCHAVLHICHHWNAGES